jgi:hypothetical protein
MPQGCPIPAYPSTENVEEPILVLDVFSGLRRLRSLGDICPDYTKGTARRNRISVKSAKSAVKFLWLRLKSGESLSREWGKRFQVYSPDNHSPDCSPAFSIRHPPALIGLRLAALRHPCPPQPPVRRLVRHPVRRRPGKGGRPCEGGSFNEGGSFSEGGWRRRTRFNSWPAAPPCRALLLLFAALPPSRFLRNSPFKIHYS